jgi:hypothetical protein
MCHRGACFFEDAGVCEKAGNLTAYSLLATNAEAQRHHEGMNAFSSLVPSYMGGMMLFAALSTALVVHSVRHRIDPPLGAPLLEGA